MAADALAGRESSRKHAVGWGRGGLGSFQHSPAPFQTGNESSIQRGSRETLARRPGSPAELPGAGGAGTLCLVLEAKLGHLRGLENPHPREEKEDGISPGVGTGPCQPETMAPGASTTPPLLRRELNTLEIGV